MNFRKRLDIVQNRLEKSEIDLFMIGPSSSLKYLVGYNGKIDERLLLLVMMPGEEPFFIANRLYELQLKKTIINDFIFWDDKEEPVKKLIEKLKNQNKKIKKVAIDKSVPSLFSIPILNSLNNCEVILGNSLIDDLRIIKDEEEIEYMAKACKLASESLSEVIELGDYWLDKTENEFMAYLAFEMSKRNLKLPSGIVAVGENAAAPHHITGKDKIKNGNGLMVDFGGNYNNYNTDMTRTFHFGIPSDEFKKVYEIVLEANRLGKEAARVGNLLEDVDRASRNYIIKKGYGEFFTHRTGHGIGIDGHEGPSACEGEKTPIVEGMAFSVEPGIYLPGKFGIRIEDQVVITKNGIKVLHDFPRKLQIK
ncbi:M24 family metallopeptidase [Peptoniphilus stercorisuis]|uniref:Xaa-Pro dipeptidase n=1 Tax=Peptoniphilus stercorisuis TaxID=1436965 RepID=A0ABS4KDS0_9FIRM|nr:Xaa-Pro peptidase family protein [Peptoniphilus stercorisuis]MBP2025916.1 Xaa-Pro dipeptidase [Peptoniphilus stercorisuis]